MLIFIKILLLCTTLSERDERKKALYDVEDRQDRMIWDAHVRKLVREGAFAQMYWMSLASVISCAMNSNYLLIVDVVMRKLSTYQPEIGTEIIVSMFLVPTMGVCWWWSLFDF
jgi:hypothetical protein